MPSNETFLQSSKDGIAVYGLSPKRRTFAVGIKDNLEQSDYQVFPIHPKADSGFYPNLKAMPGKVKSAYIAINPNNALSIINDLSEYGIKRAWFQYGAYNDEVLKKCNDSGIETYSGCLMMYIPSAGFIHKFHRFLYELFGGKK
ncbi:MAG: CoA-binding protein [candidate division Zixibacteria bacterium]|nr:CoA-binding protein [candidate division Zixibacteria bacterium]